VEVGDADPTPPTTVTIAALGGRPWVRLDEAAFRRLADRAGGFTGPDLTRDDLGRLITAAREAGPRHLLDALLGVRAATPVYTLKSDGRPWRPAALPTPVAPHSEHPTGIHP
jgi:hypothetical protein